eukprot:1393832-Amorphochlora_amoeboformis.AAC.3
METVESELRHTVRTVRRKSSACASDRRDHHYAVLSGERSATQTRNNGKILLAPDYPCRRGDIASA